MLSALLVVFFLVPVARAAASGTINLTIVGSGSGTVTSSGGLSPSPGQLDCAYDGSSQSGTCSATFLGVAGFFPVNLTATAASGSTFVSWENTGGGKGSCAEPSPSTANPCRFTALSDSTEGAANLTARFAIQLPAPAVTIEPPSPVGPDAATLHGTVDPNGNAAGWHFEYRRVGASVWTNAPVPDGDAGAGDSAVAVEATVEGLEPRTEYEVRLRAANATTAETSGTATFQTLAVPPELDSGRAWSVGDTDAELFGSVNTHNSELTDCRFEYGTTEAYGEEAACVFDDAAGEASEGPGEFPLDGVAHSVHARIEGLDPSTAYHFRLVASNECPEGCGTAEGEDAGFQTYPTASFPARGIELVSAADTNGIAAEPDFAAADGDRYAYGTFIPVPGSVNGIPSHFVASRNADGSWSQRSSDQSTSADGSSVDEQGVTNMLYSGDLSLAVFGNRQGTDPDDRNGSFDTYLRRLFTAGGSEWLSRDPRIPAGTAQAEAGAADPVDVSADGSRVLFEAERPLAAVDTNGAKDVYRWDRTASPQVSLVGAVPAAGSTECDEVGGPACTVAANGSKLGSGAESSCSGSSSGTTYGAVSADGSRVFFEAGSGLYARIDGSRTLELSASQGVSPPVTEPRDVCFAGASGDGSVVFFTSRSALTQDSEATGSFGAPADLYSYDLETETLRDLTPFAGGAGVRRVYAASGDGRRVYFTSTTRLEGEGVEGGYNLYLANLDGQGAPAGPLAFIATVDKVEDEPGGVNTGWMNGPQKEREAAISPDGDLLAFRDRLPAVPGRSTAYGSGSGDTVFGSTRITDVNTASGAFRVGAEIFGPSLRGGTTIESIEGSTITLSVPATGTANDAALTAGLAQVFVYDADRGELSCVSCPPDGSAPSAPANLTMARRSSVSATPAPGGFSVDRYGPRPRSFSTAGTLFFQTATPLLESDVNEAIDVYEWRGGQLHLVTPGRVYGSAPSAGDAGFASASANGSTVFFTSFQALVPGVEAGTRHIYAARVGGGYQPPFSSGPSCAGGDCRASSPPATQRQGAGSSGFRGEGNVAAGGRKRCRKGARRVRRHGHVRCVKRRSGRTRHRHHGRHRRPATHNRRTSR